MSAEYDIYLNDHIKYVQMAYEWIRNSMPELNGISDRCVNHDYSKYSDDEYDAYDKYFYGGNKSNKVVKDFNYAWLHHIHNNPHHWQHWVLIHDDEPEEALEMPIEYVVEMVADWWSFSWRNRKLTEVLDWYDKHAGGMKLHPKTRRLVEKILSKIREVYWENDEKTV